MSDTKIWSEMAEKGNDMDKNIKNVDNTSERHHQTGIIHTPATKLAMKICYDAHQILPSVMILTISAVRMAIQVSLA